MITSSRMLGAASAAMILAIFAASADAFTISPDPFTVSTNPAPVQEGRAFSVTVGATMFPNIAGNPNGPAVTVEGNAITVGLRHSCGFLCPAAQAFYSETFSVPALAAGTYAMSIYQGELPTASSSTAYLPVAQYSIAVASRNYQGLWWKSPAGSESGWGMSIDHQGDILFAVWFTYDASGNAAWFVVPRAEKASPGVYSGPIYQTKGPPFDSPQWNATAATNAAVGTATLSFTDSTNGTFAYTVNGVSGSKVITRQIFSSPVATCVAPTS